MWEASSPRESLIDKIVDFCQTEKRTLQAELALLESGDCKTGERKATALNWIDTTEKTTTRLRARILEIDSVLLLIWEAQY